ncbi:MAG: hypothetical protein HQM12_14740 [SAR324 cluster bacterium]|nr:hypothetical protein [SAR324 cluster bacterium]
MQFMILIFLVFAIHGFAQAENVISEDATNIPEIIQSIHIRKLEEHYASLIVGTGPEYRQYMLDEGLFFENVLMIEIQVQQGFILVDYDGKTYQIRGDHRKRIIKYVKFIF